MTYDRRDDVERLKHIMRKAGLDAILLDARDDSEGDEAAGARYRFDAAQRARGEKVAVLLVHALAPLAAEMAPGETVSLAIYVSIRAGCSVMAAGVSLSADGVSRCEEDEIPF